MQPNSAIDLIREAAAAGLIVRMKVETEAEGANWDLISLLKNTSALSGVPLVLKIGGCEARTDMVKARWLGIDEITAPMIESAFAAFKFKEAFKGIYGSNEPTTASLLVESVSGAEEIEKIVGQSTSWARGINIGRSDLASSMSLDQNEQILQDSEQVSGVVSRIAKIAKHANLEVTIGGKMTEESVVFLTKSLGDVVPDYVETRRFVLGWNAISSDPSRLNAVLKIERLLAEEAAGAFNWETSKASQYVAELDNRISPRAPRSSVI